MIDSMTQHGERIHIEEYLPIPERWADLGYSLAGPDAVVRAQMIARLKKGSAEAEGKAPQFRIVRVQTLRTIIEETS